MKQLIYIITLSLMFPLNSCKRNIEKSYGGTTEFNNIEEKLAVKGARAIKYYDDHFEKNFVGENKAAINSNFLRVIYIYQNNYYVGYIHKYDKKGPRNGNMHFLAKIDSKTGEVSAIK